MQRSMVITTLGTAVLVSLASALAAQDAASRAAKPPASTVGAAPQAAKAPIDADTEKVLVLTDFESPDEIFNAAKETDLAKAHKLASNRPVWTSQADFRWTVNHLDLSNEHVFHGKHSLKGHANVGSGHAWSKTVRNSFPGDWSEYDAIRFFAHSAETKPVQWAFFIWMGYTDADGKRQEWQPWLLFDVKPGDSQIEIPLSAFDDLKWKGPIGGTGVAENPTAMKLWDQDKKYQYIHETGWKFDDIRCMAVGLRGNYDPKVPHDWWIDYLRLVKRKKPVASTSPSPSTR